jgi:hypothetical protein
MLNVETRIKIFSGYTDAMEKEFNDFVSSNDISIVDIRTTSKYICLIYWSNV